jgi:hypothetical protein
MHLHDALRQIATATNLNPDELIAYTAEDQVGGRDDNSWPGMSVFAAEGQVLYALIRALKPAQVVEVGVDSGGTSTHMLTALERNGEGQLYSVDINPEVGSKVPADLRNRWTLRIEDALTVDLPDRADVIFEDGSHELAFTRAILTRLKALNPRVILSHDYYTHETYGGFYVKEAFDAVLPGGFGVKIEGAFTGLGVWLNPDWQPAHEPPLPADEVVEEPTRPLKPLVDAPKATRKAGKRG